MSNSCAVLVAIVDSNSLPQCGRELVGPLINTAEFGGGGGGAVLVAIVDSNSLPQCGRKLVGLLINTAEFGGGAVLVAIVDSNSLPQCGRELVGPLMAEFARRRDCTRIIRVQWTLGLWYFFKKS